MTPPTGPDAATDADPDDEGHLTLATQSGVTFGGNLVKKLFGFVVVAVITRLVSPGVYGLFVLATSIVLFVQMFAIAGLPKAIDYYVPQYANKGEYGKARGILLQVVGLVLLTSFTVAVALFLAAEPLAELFGEPSLQVPLELLSAALPLLALYNVLLASFNAMKRLRFRVYVRDVTRPLVRLTVTALLLGLFGLGVLGLIVGYLAGLAVCILVGVVLLYRRGDVFRRGPPEWTPYPELLWYSLPLALAGVIYVVMGQIDYFVVGYYLQSDSVGIYRVGYMLASNLLIIFSSLAPVFKPLIAEVRSDDELVTRRYRTATRWAVALTLPLLYVAVLGASTYLSLIFTPQYAEADVVVFVLAMGYLVSIVCGGPGGSLLQGLGYSRLVFLNTSLLFVTNIVVDLLLVPRIGILGAGIATASALTVAGVAAMTELYTVRRIHPFTPSLARVVLVSLPSAAAGAAVVLFVPNQPLVAVLLPVVVLAVYGVSLRLGDAVTTEDVRIAGQISPRLRTTVLERLLGADAVEANGDGD